MRFAVKLSTGKWDYVCEDVEGLTSWNQTIQVRPHASRPKIELDNWLHESLHAILPDCSEKEIERIAGDLTKVIWKAGYRKS